MLTWKKWDIKYRLIFMAVIPVILMFFSEIFYSCYSRDAEVQRELKERGDFLVHTLAESSLYGVISGNTGYMERTAREFLHLDKSIHRIIILDKTRKVLVDTEEKNAPEKNIIIFEKAIQQERIPIDYYDYSDNKKQPSSAHPALESGIDVIGYILIEMSPSVAIRKEYQRIILGSVISAVVLFLSVALGLMMALTFTKPLAQAIGNLRQIRAGNYGVKLDVTTGGEIGELQASIRQMVDSLQQAKINLEAKVSARTQDLEIAKKESEKSNEEKKKLIKKLNSVVEEERKSIAIELHDHINASLIVVRLESQYILSLAEQAGAAKQAIQEKAHAIIRLTADLYVMGRNIVRRLRPEIIDTLGLQAAVEEMVQNYDALHPECHFSLTSEGDFSACAGDILITIYRLIQEGLSNIVKHAGATLCLIHIECLPEVSKVRIHIGDNGQGFNPDQTGSGIGLIGMKERVHGAGGQLHIESDKKHGTRIIIDLPKSHREVPLTSTIDRQCS
ncbi:ATP-binding protein [Herbaspirillum sp. RTI4]|uniref:ATP-binding protein n=1 Tax=Herbaspirillum sp. RTI4 TaxID=3048640 RepID=UPI002AB52146|nr:ATP-binding protein [Herbaspirillum sp. RTI4]MDY7578063.1 ATP-binding protein [Herbaspirillum sp. RTI4]MEA9983193.1 ATP-binding protein [Herbaspirillum sp. RTI4]